MPADNSNRLGVRLLSSADVEAYFGRGPRTIRRWRKQGHLKAITVGRSVFFHPDEVRAHERRQLAHAIAVTAGLSTDPECDDEEQ